ncbi:hypothetical protein, partial [Pseudomonas aeruginosa]
MAASLVVAGACSTFASTASLAAGLTTFITMAYIIFVNPNIMADA